MVPLAVPVVWLFTMEFTPETFPPRFDVEVQAAGLDRYVHVQLFTRLSTGTHVDNRALLSNICPRLTDTPGYT